ncbi:MAG: methyl-accepting chemotaxis protein, partial [Sulfuricellaceae bacterium]|jgi:methyl-accepting chemotaxis protein
VTQMDEVTQQNAALVEEAAAAAESLQEQAESLAQAVSVFKLDTGSAVAATAKRPAVQEGPQAEKAEEGHAKARHAGKVVPHPASHAKRQAPRVERSGGKMLAHKPAEEAEEWSEF